MKELKFPEGFLWGAATASYQVEGGIENCDWAQAAREGKVPVCGEAADQYNRYEHDFDLAKDLGHNFTRISIEWARIEPEEGKFDPDAIEHYKKVLSAIHKRGLKPMVTFWHFTLPTWFSDKGGFNQKNSPEIFMRYCLYVIGSLHEYCDLWDTINEPMVWVNNGYTRANWPPFKRNPIKFWGALQNLIKAHNLVYQEIKKLYPALNVGVVKDNINFVSDWKPWNKIARAAVDSFWNHYFLKRTHKNCDHIGLNYYFHSQIGKKKYFQKNDMGWDLNADGMRQVLIDLKRYKKPIYISEAGTADHADAHRPEYIRDLVKATHEAISAGSDVKGFLYWSLIDNYEWALGFEKEFGLIHVDRKTQERTVRNSALVYKKICESNSLTIE